MGVDLGLKETATPSHGKALEAGRFYRDLASALGKAQRAYKKARVKAIHAKIKNRRKDALHKFSSVLVHNNAAIFVGDVSPSGLAKTKMAKSVLDAGWGMLKTQLAYKAIARSVVFEVVSESYPLRRKAPFIHGGDIRRERQRRSVVKVASVAILYIA